MDSLGLLKFIVMRYMTLREKDIVGSYMYI